MKYKFTDIFNITELKKLCESFTQINGTVTALLDLDGKVYISTGWQDLCTQFHRKHPVCSKRCTESDTILSSQAKSNSRYNIYKCKNGLIDISLPIYIRNEHVANFFTGQFLFEPPDREYFRKQAQQFGFNEQEYLLALEKIPVFSENEIKKSALFLVNLTESIGETGLKNIQLKESTTKLKDEKKKYKILFEEAVDAITLIYPNGTFFDVNRSACSLFNLSKNDILGKSIIDLSPGKQYNNENSADKAKKLIELTLNNKPQRFEWLHCDSSGNKIDTSISLKKISLSGEIYLQTIIRDITKQKKQALELDKHRKNLELLVKERTEELATANEELQSTNEELYSKNQFINKQNKELKKTLQQLKKAQLKLIQAEKMASLGTLTAGVAHEINNPLNYLMGAYTGLEKYFKKNGSKQLKKTQTLLNIIKVGTNRIANIVKGLNQFSRSTEKLDEVCNINSIIDNCLVMLRSQIKNIVNVEKEYQDTLKIPGNVGKMHQVFMNILSNSIQAITENGHIKIITKITKEKAIIEISDNGIGIVSKHLSQITDPFFTTKAPGEGTGLGLSITYNIIKEHKGTIKFESETNKGTKVIVTLPIYSPNYESIEK